MFRLFLYFFLMFPIYSQIKSNLDGYYDTNYCDISCNYVGDPETYSHVMCALKPFPFSNNCQIYKPYQDRLNRFDKYYLLRLHNEFRSLVAAGEDLRRRVQQPMLELRWKNELARMAQRTADQCRPGRDQCRDLPYYRVGQNTFTGITDLERQKEKLKQAVDAWYNCTYDEYSFLHMIGPMTRHLGCARSRTMLNEDTNSTYQMDFIICNYGPEALVPVDPHLLPICPKSYSWSHFYRGLCDRYDDYDEPYYYDASPEVHQPPSLAVLAAVALAAYAANRK